jgi:hypothetical protein
MVMSCTCVGRMDKNLIVNLSMYVWILYLSIMLDDAMLFVVVPCLFMLWCNLVSIHIVSLYLVI